MSEITIDKNVQLPPAKPKKEYKSTMDKMLVGDSFLATLEERQNLSSLINHVFHTVSKKRFRTSSKDQPDGMFRVWRVEDYKE